MEPVRIFGAGPYARLLRRLVEDAGRRVEAFAVDPEWRNGEQFEGLPLIDWATDSADAGEWLVALGYRSMNARASAAIRIADAGGRLATVVSPAAHVASEADLGAGTVVFPGCVIEPGATLGRNVVLWSGGVVCHDTTVGDHCYLAPATVLSGNCRVGAGCFLGTRVTVIDGVAIGNDCQVDAAALMTRDAAEKGRYRGVPARRIAEIDPIAGIAIAR